jgi:hypothetical protein
MTHLGCGRSALGPTRPEPTARPSGLYRPTARYGTTPWPLRTRKSGTAGNRATCRSITDSGSTQPWAGVHLSSGSLSCTGGEPGETQNLAAGFSKGCVGPHWNRGWKRWECSDPFPGRESRTTTRTRNLYSERSNTGQNTPSGYLPARTRPVGGWCCLWTGKNADTVTAPSNALRPISVIPVPPKKFAFSEQMSTRQKVVQIQRTGAATFAAEDRWQKSESTSQQRRQKRPWRYP